MECRTYVGGCVGRYDSVVILYDFFDNRQTNSCPYVVIPPMQTLKNLKNLFTLIRIEPNSVIFYCNIEILSIF